ncbi:Uma2 family endonuclease [Nocardiopsis sp. CNT312]|uniref:Uma2 family endonuclease n=1 Tax=Nocardiopsis sp. CNT312 TaxID=1137268 RepID=UPI0009E0333C|nr:Uma2 family endonuclease [Nocardiopsis sp. CNT312]
MATRHTEAPERRLTVDDLEHTPDDGRRYALVDGCCDVSPAPVPRHRSVDSPLTFRLADKAPDEFTVLTGPGVNLNADRTHDRIPEPAAFGCVPPDRGHRQVPPVPAVEIVSPESVLRDNHTTRAEYAAFGIASYWIISPLPDKVGIVEFRLEDGPYQEVAQACGEEVLETELPFPVRFVPHRPTTRGPWREHIGGRSEEGTTGTGCPPSPSRDVTPGAPWYVFST